MTSRRIGLPREEFVNEPEDPQIGSIVRAATSLTNMDARQQKIALVCIISVGVASCILGFLCMFAISESSLSMMSRLSRDSFYDEDFINEEIFERITRKDLEFNLKFFSEEPHPAGKRRNEEVLADEIKRFFEKARMDYVEVQSYNVLLSYPKGINKVSIRTNEIFFKV